MRELQDHPQREEIVKENPKITTREAQKLKREHGGKLNNKSGNWRLEERKRWLRRVYSLANEIVSTAEVVRHKEGTRDRRENTFPIFRMIPSVRDRIFKLAREMKSPTAQCPFPGEQVSHFGKTAIFAFDRSRGLLAVIDHDHRQHVSLACEQR